ncbi:DUF1836 domain-containing protein [Clostridium hydrogenum]|uniref:DUF1836 domain-containing protein n=1 Tax=Clostridium hydrogenum TaxID=2855764 RepID=UPI001F431E55|nr:DUF1836 domain-containing protein [Clostridium hydrogenum]
MNDDILKLAKSIINYNEIKDYEIPDIDLYMDQVTSFMDTKLKDFKRDENDIILTKTMINNYVKSNVIPSPVKKKYSKKHLMVLIWIYHLKQTLSITDIGKLMNFIIKDKDEEIKYNEIYNNFLDIEKKSHAEFEVNLSEMLKNVDDKYNSDEKLFLLVIELILSSNLQKRMAEKIIDNYFNNDAK